MTRKMLYEIFLKKKLTYKYYKDRIIRVSNIPISYIPHKESDHKYEKVKAQT